MKTFSTHLITNNQTFNQPKTTRRLYEKYSYHQRTSDINRNAAVAQVEYERDACEEELYRLRYGIENLLMNNEQGGFQREQQQRKYRDGQNPFRTMTNRISDSTSRRNRSWLDRCCSPCCRRWRSNRYDDNVHSNRHIYNDRNNDIPTRRIPQSSRPIPYYSDSYVSMSPSPSVSSRYIDQNMTHTKNDLRSSIDNLIHQSKTAVSDVPTSKDLNDPAYHSMIVKILEAKALDCLCSGYVKQNTQKQIEKAFSNRNRRVIDEYQSDTASVTSSPTSYESSSVSSISTDDESISPRFIPPVQSSQQIPSPSPSDMQTPNIDRITSTLISPSDSTRKIKSSLKLDDSIPSPRKDSKVTIGQDKTSPPDQPKNKKKSSSKHRKSTKSRSKQSRKPTSRTKKRSKSKVSSKRPSSSKLKKRGTSKSRSKSKSSKKPKSKKSRKRTKPKSNNHMNDYPATILPTFLYPQFYQAMYRNREKA